MTNIVIADERRQHRAAVALNRLGANRADRHVPLIECRRGHTLGAVYATDEGLVFFSRPRPGALDERDLTGLEHHRCNRPRREFTDLLYAAWVDDDLPAGCYCGDHTLSRMSLQSDIDAGRRLVVVS